MKPPTGVARARSSASIDDDGRHNRDGRGRYVPGHCIPGPGRPRAIDLRALAERKSAASGTPLDDMLWEVLLAMVDRAKRGDASAAKLVLDRLSDTDPMSIHVTADSLSDTERAARLEAILAGAAARRDQQREDHGAESA